MSIKKATTAEWLSYSKNSNRGALWGAKVTVIFDISKKK
jgi:hypothetical protein